MFQTSQNVLDQKRKKVSLQLLMNAQLHVEVNLKSSSMEVTDLGEKTHALMAIALVIVNMTQRMEIA